MNQPALRFLTLFLCLVLLCGVVPSSAEDMPTGVDDSFVLEAVVPEEEVLFEDRFGPGAWVETDETGEPVSVNGYPTYPVRAGFNVLGQTDSFQTVVDFLDYPFWQPATQYDGNLAVMSLMMAGCANRAVGFRDVSAEDFDPSLNVVHFLTDAGFEDIREDDYSKVPTMFTVSTAMGHRKMAWQGQEPFTLIAIGVCGEGYKNEWESNFTAGTGSIHEGFQSAAQLVIDRLAGYIATRGIQGRVKVWISGFSRAAAVSNVVAGTLVKTGFLPKEDVYAYTFATPAAVKNPPQQGYENIFNIINPADLVPQVMPAEWGYGRYGTDMFLAVQEFASYEGYLDNTLRNYTNKIEYDVEYNYSSRLTLRTRLLMSLILELTEDTENYVACFQPALVGIMHKKTVSSTVAILRTLMQEITILDQEDKTHLDALIDYFLRVFSGIALRSGYLDADQNTGSAFIRFLVEHTPNAYYSAVGSIRNGEFTDNDRCCYVMARGPVSLTVRDETNALELFTIHSDGSISYSEFLNDFDLTGKLIYAERSGQTTVVGIPLDNDYQVTWTAEKDGAVEFVQATTFVRARSQYPGAVSDKIRVRAGETGVAFQSKDHESLPLPGFKEMSFSAMELAAFMGIISLGFNWRLALTVLCA